MTNDPALKRRVGPVLLTLYGLGVMVGAGIYVMVGEIAGMVGLFTPFAFLGAALVAAPSAMSYGELAGRIPESGGEAAYLREAFGFRFLPFLAAVMIVGGATLSAAAVTQGGVGYLQAVLDLPRAALIVIVVGLLTAAALIGVVESLALAAVLTLIEVGGLLFVAWAGFAAEPSPEWRLGLGAQLAAFETPGALAGGMAAAAILGFFAFIGFEDMVNMAEETRDPGRVMAISILGALGATAALYALVSAAALHALPGETLATSAHPLSLVVEAGAPGAGPGLALVAVAAALNGVLAQIVMGSRMVYGLARRLDPGGPGSAKGPMGLILRALGRAHPRLGTPVAGTLLMAVLVIAVALSTPLASLAAGSASVLLAVFVAINAALIVLRRKGPAPAGAWTAPAWAPWVGAALAVALLALGAL